MEVAAGSEWPLPHPGPLAAFVERLGVCRCSWAAGTMRGVAVHSELHPHSSPLSIPPRLHCLAAWLEAL